MKTIDVLCQDMIILLGELQNAGYHFSHLFASSTTRVISSLATISLATASLVNAHASPMPNINPYFQPIENDSRTESERSESSQSSEDENDSGSEEVVQSVKRIKR